MLCVKSKGNHQSLDKMLLDTSIPNVIFVGDAYFGSGSSSGSILLATGNAGQGNSGDIDLMTGGSEGGDTGSINITVRNSNCGNGGNIAMRAGLSQRHS